MKSRPAARASLAVLLPLVFVAACGDVDPPPAAQGTATPLPATPVPASIEPSPAPASEGTDAVVALTALHYVRGQAFHDLATSVAEASEVNPRWSGSAANTVIVVEGVSWPEPVVASAAALVDELTAFAHAVEAEDLDAARTAAEAIHERDHDLQEVAYEWLATVAPPDPGDTNVATLSVLASIDVIDQSSFHDLAEDVAKATETNPRWEGTARRALTALGLAAWPSNAAREAEALRTALTEFAAAVSAEDLAAAIPAAESLHDTQHDLSVVTYEWLAGNHPAMGHAGSELSFACLLRATDAAARMAFHDLAAELAGANEINPRLASRLENLLVVLDFETENGLTTPFVAQVAELRDAAVDGDLEAARQAAEAVHDMQHDFSEAAFDHMASLAGGETSGQ